MEIKVSRYPRPSSLEDAVTLQLVIDGCTLPS
jgi:hypothetical protein